MKLYKSVRDHLVKEKEGAVLVVLGMDWPSEMEAMFDRENLFVTDTETFAIQDVERELEELEEEDPLPPGDIPISNIPIPPTRNSHASHSVWQIADPRKIQKT